MKNNKGFTLIELLTIIVLLTILTLITVPVTQKIIKNAKISTAEQSAEGFADGIDKYITGENFTENLELTGYYTITNGIMNGPDMDNVKIPVQGKRPTSGFLRLKENTIVGGCLIVNEYEAKFRDGNFKSEGKGTCTSNFATDSWADIKYNLSVDRDAYPIGSLKTVKMNLTGEEKEYTLRLINTSHPAACETRDIAGNMKYSQSSCGVVIEFVTIIENRELNGSEADYSKTSLRKHLNTDEDSIYNKLPDDLKAVIIETSPLGTGYNSNTIYSYSEKLFPLALKEVNLHSDWDFGNNITRPLDFYATNNNNNARKKYTSTNNMTSSKYWLRTRDNHWNEYQIINTDGSRGYTSTITEKYGIAPAFRIAE